MRFLPVAYPKKGGKKEKKSAEESKEESEQESSKVSEQSESQLQTQPQDEESKEKLETSQENSEIIVEAMQWGLYRPGSNDLVINGRFEELCEKPMFRGLLEKKRCVVSN